MKNLWLYLQFGIYMVGTLFKKPRINSLRKQGKIKEADKLAYEKVLGWAEFLVKKVGINIEVEGISNIPKGNCVYVANHQSLFDIPVLLAATKKPMGFIAKKEMENIKVLSSWMREIHCVFMDRNNIREAVKSINEGIDNIKKGYSMVIFPEGTRSKGPKLNEFKKGSMKLAIKGGVPIVPIAIDGTYKAREANEGNKLKSANVKITIAKPIYVENLTKEQKGNLAEDIKGILNNILKY
ncbi:lysophospholipid acyltransferase family protein [Clostridium rectalis]|uniref:lysophospholipid acyltransferase family protein n=1 Tax=Clostridium rectalis TaxID=2040295 RepID=UPI000F643AD9|nr:lysophospholipid acyltransferase family protein [Clostridium rectalis]